MYTNNLFISRYVHSHIYIYIYNLFNFWNIISWRRLHTCEVRVGWGVEVAHAVGYLMCRMLWIIYIQVPKKTWHCCLCLGIFPCYLIKGCNYCCLPFHLLLFILPQHTHMHTYVYNECTRQLMGRNLKNL